jgi:hypothetical protein
MSTTRIVSLQSTPSLSRPILLLAQLFCSPPTFRRFCILCSTDRLADQVIADEEDLVLLTRLCKSDCSVSHKLSC